jgi:hypothetical protein
MNSIRSGVAVPPYKMPLKACITASRSKPTRELMKMPSP